MSLTRVERETTVGAIARYIRGELADCIERHGMRPDDCIVELRVRFPELSLDPTMLADAAAEAGCPLDLLRPPPAVHDVMSPESAKKIRAAMVKIGDQGAIETQRRIDEMRAAIGGGA